MVRLARTGKRVLRLKAVTHSYSAAVVKQSAFQVVPGITTAFGCATYTRIPLTHRNYAQSCVFVAGHVRDGSMDLNWDALVQRQQTIVIYMALKGLTLLCQQLIKHGMSSDTPAALIEQGTTPRQRVFVWHPRNTTGNDKRCRCACTDVSNRWQCCSLTTKTRLVSAWAISSKTKRTSMVLAGPHIYQPV